MGTFLSVALQVLREQKRPLSARDITSLAVARRLLKSEGKTPAQTMKSKLSTHILRHKHRSPFMRTARGEFGLREWSQYEEHVADRYQRALFDEDIVVIPAQALQTFTPQSGIYKGAMDPRRLWSFCQPMRRRLAEDDVTVIQLVSAFIVSYREAYITYKRAKRLPEARLHGFSSITFGGHLNPDDIPELFDLLDPAQSFSFLSRELSEEIILPRDGIMSISYRGLLYDDSREVSKQHLGILYDVHLRDKEFRIGERGFLIQPRFESLEEVIARASDFENWSQLVIQDLAATR